MGITTRNADKKNLQKQAKIIKQKKIDGIIRKRKEKATQEKFKIKFEAINKKVEGEERRLKRYQQRLNQYRQNRTFQNIFYQQFGGDDTKTYQQPGTKNLPEILD